jgi:hypothetical protein
MIRLNLSADLRRALERLQPGSAKIFGSSLWFTERVGDIDIAVPDDDDATFAYLLNIAPAFNLHPVRMARWLYDDLHNRLSWKNMCGTQDARTGEVTLSKDYVHSDFLQFNPASRKAFPDFAEARRAAKKMEERGYRVPDSEKARASLHLTGSLSNLETLAREALTEEVVWLIAGHDAAVAGGFFRDEVDGRPPKDIDVFVPADHKWEQLCDDLAKIMEEVEFEKPEGKRVNLRKFRARSRCPGHEMLVIDVIDYGFVHSSAHVVETFDFSCNTLWWSPALRRGIQGGFGLEAADVVRHIRERKLVVGDNLWYRAGLYRALKRWQRFRGDGYVADAANTAKYSEYVRLFAGK